MQRTPILCDTARQLTRIVTKSMSTRLALAVLTAGLITGCAGFQDRLFGAGLLVERWRSGMVERRSGTGETVYLERPGEGETVVLLHGFAANKDVWLQFTRHLPQSYRVIAIDLPGHGDSAKGLAEHYGAARLTEHFAHTVNELGLKRFHLAGSSLGGLISTYYALDHPDRVLTLGLFAPAGVYPPTPSELQHLLEQGDNPLLVDSRQDFDRLLDFLFVETPFMPWPVRPVLAREFVARSVVNRKIWTDLVSEFEDLRSLLPGLRMPTLIVWGEGDRVLHASSIEVYREFVPQLRTVVMSGTGHTPMTEHPRRTAIHYRRFLRTRRHNHLGGVSPGDI